jgi:hypothetical protein
MKKLLEEIKNLIHQQFHYTDETRKEINLMEKEAQNPTNNTKGEFVKLVKTEAESFTIELDKRKTIKVNANTETTIDIHPLLSDGIKNLKKECDYLIFCRLKSQIFVLLIELKSDNPDGWLRQTKTGESIAKYLLGIVENYKQINLTTQVEFRHLLFTTKVKKKKKTKTQAFEYERHPKFGFLFTRKACNAEYDLEIFLR